MRSLLVRYAAAAVLFALVIALWLHEVVLHPGSRIPGYYGDGTASIRGYWAAATQHQNPFDFTHDLLLQAPEGYRRAPASVLANSGIQTAFIWLARGPLGLVGAWNAFLLVGMFATAMAMFVLLDRIGCSFVPSLFGGLVFGLGPYEVERAYAGHASLAQNWVFVVVLAALLRWSTRRSLTWSAVVGGSIALAFYLSAYQGLLASLMALVFFGIAVVRPGARGHRLLTAGQGALAYVVVVVSLIPIVVFYAAERSVFRDTAGRPVGDLSVYAASFSAYLLPSLRNPLLRHLGGFGRWLLSHRPADFTEKTLFVGYTTVAFAAVAAVLVLRRDRRLSGPGMRGRTAVFACILAPAAFLLSFPASNHVAGVSLPGPSRILAEFTTYYRVYARFGELVGMALAILAALALSALAERSGRFWKVLPLLALGAVVLELLPGKALVVNTSFRPRWVDWLATAPPGVVATYPSLGPGTPLLAQRDEWYQRYDGHPRFAILEGQNAAQLQSRGQAIRFLARDVDDPLTPRVLSTEDVRYAVLHDDVYRQAGRRPPQLDPRSYHLLRRFGDVRVFAVHAKRVDIAEALAQNREIIAQLEGLVPPSVSFDSAFYPSEPFEGGTGRWMGDGGVLELRNPGEPMSVTLTGLAFSNARPRVLEVEDGDGRVVARQTIPAHAVPLALGPIDVPNGTTKLRLVTVPGSDPLGGSDPRTASVFLGSLAAEPRPAYDGA